MVQKRDYWSLTCSCGRFFAHVDNLNVNVSVVLCMLKDLNVGVLKFLCTVLASMLCCWSDAVCSNCLSVALVGCGDRL